MDTQHGYTWYTQSKSLVTAFSFCLSSMNIFFAKDPNLGAMVKADTMPCTDRTYTNRRVGKPHLRRKTAG